MLCLLVLLLASQHGAAALFAWHLTDVHVDPYYREGSRVDSGCFCEPHSICPRMPSICGPVETGGAGEFGNSENSCATPQALFDSALAFMNATAVGGAGPTLVLFTGDFVEAGAGAACSPTSPAQQQVVDIVRLAFDQVRRALPQALIFGCLGNHDTAPGDVFGSSAEMQWLYSNLTQIWAPEVANSTETVLRGGYYLARALPGLQVLALNTNYWTYLNPLMQNKSGDAYMAGEAMLAWMAEALAAVAAAGDRVLVLGHIPPLAIYWLPEFAAGYAGLVARYNASIVGQFYGHDHVDEWLLTREAVAPLQWSVTAAVDRCDGGNAAGDLDVGNLFGAGNTTLACAVVPAGVANASICQTACAGLQQCAGFTWMPAGDRAQCCFARDCAVVHRAGPGDANTCYRKEATSWRETRGIKWCSGANFPVFDAFGAGFDPKSPHCAYLPAAVANDTGTMAGMCQDFCEFGLANASLCAGFTFYSGESAPNQTTQCCFRQDTSQKPPDPTSAAVCYEKQALDRPATGVVFVGPSLTEGYPPANPAVRRYELSDGTHELLDSTTWFLDLATANARGEAEWQMEYEFKSFFGAADMSAAQLEGVIAGMAVNGSAVWDRYRGQGAGSLFYKGYGGASAEPCSGSCQAAWLALMNGTAAAP